MVLGGDGEGVAVDARGGYVGEVLEGLYQVEVITGALLEAIVAVELDESGYYRVNTGGTLNERVRVARVKDGGVPEIGVVERLLAVVLVDNGVVAADEIITLYYPREELNGVVEVHADLVGGGRDALLASELELLDEVLVRALGELATLISVKVDVIYEQRASLEALVLYVRVDRGVGGPAHVLYAGEINKNLHLVVLEADQRQGKARVAAVEELQRDVQGVSRGALAYGSRRYRLSVAISRAYILTALTSGGEEVYKLRYVTYHTGVTTLLAYRERELVPDVHPVTILLIDLLATDLKLYLLDQVVARPVEPAESSRSIRRGLRDVNLGKRSLYVRLPDQIAVARDLARYVLAVEGGSAVEGLLDRLNREVRVAAIYHLEESNFRVTGKVHILSTISYELHKTARHCIPFHRNISRFGTS